MGSLAISTILFIVTTHDWDIYDYLGRSFLKHVFISIPHFWIAVFAVLILSACYSFTRTKHGYREAISRVFLGSIIGSLILGTALFFCGVNSQVHEFFSRNVPFYNDLIYYKEDIWDKPEKGLLAGEVSDVRNKNEFILTDFKGNTWHIVGDNIMWPDNIVPQNGIEIKIIGRQQNDNIFYGNTVRRW